MAETCELCGGAADGQRGCQKLFEEDVLVKDYSDYRYGKTHRLTVDVYSLQHPETYMISGKSFAAHLTGVCAALEYEDGAATNRAMQKWLSTNPAIEKPSGIPRDRGSITINYLIGAIDPEQHAKRVREWADSVWGAWSDHHELARQLINKAIVHAG